ncbi:ATP-binding cassette domain-containing protein [Streptomyces sp. NBC_01481]|uniref:ATP-binding cassette domain-containing protein n=1 Tax=Streptomyces sp. NBC_01481 TaxID=2975869 RepID=UPI00225A1204|nr:ATP-binding cassette domain-containing protein [Streptomyces sp. NBC_01481]MCX4587875.1 ATP-binding cassette domain-containing protein [Streptomyces sp. NBC_01481]
MLQAIGLTSAHRRAQRPAVDDVTFEARQGLVTALLGAAGSGKTTALRLMLQLEAGRGVTYFRGNPLHRIAHPASEVGVLLGDVPGHPARTARGQLRMLCAAAGVPASRADEMLEAVGLAGLGGERLGTLSLGMDRRLGLASALLGDPQTLILDEPTKGLSPQENSWMYGLLRAHAAHGGTVLCTTSDPKEAARLADRVVTLDAGRLVADQDAAAFSRTRLRPRVAVRTPQAARLAAVVAREARAAQRSVEVVTESGSLLSVYGSNCAEIGETAFRHGVLVHRLSDEVGDAGPEPDPAHGSEPTPAPAGAAAAALQPPPAPATQEGPPPAEQAPHPPNPPQAARPPVPPQSSPLPRPVRSPLRPLRYELRRLLGVRTALFVLGAVLVSSAALCVLLGRTGGTPLPALLTAWPEFFPLPPAAFGAGLLGALSFGEEFRYPALAAARGTVPRRLGLLLAKLAVTAAAALLIALLVAVADFQTLRLAYGSDAVPVPQNWPALMASWSALAVGCAWAGLLGAGVFRVTAAGVAAVLAVPVLIAPLVQKALIAPSVRSIAGLPGRLRELTWVWLPQQADDWLMAGVHLLAQPVGAALMLSLSALICAYLFTGLRRSARW